MRAVVLVGGVGTRLRPLTNNHPKQMLPIVGVPMIERVVSTLGAHGVTEAVLSLGYRPDAFLDAYPNSVCAGVLLHYAVEPEPLDTAGAVRFAALSAEIDDTFIVVNGDVLTDLDVTELWEFHKSHSAEGTIALTPVTDPSRYGVVPTAEDGRVLEFVEKPAPGTAPTNWINAGTYVLEPSVLDRIAPDRKVSIERETFPAMVAEQTLYALHSDAYWIDAGTPSAYLRAQIDLIDGTRGSEEALADSEDIDSSAVVTNSVLGADVVVGNGTVIHDSVVMDRVTIGPGVHIHGSIIASGARIGPDSSITALSVLGENVELPARSELVGVHLPESNE
ncbi:MAG: NDP-sugar synthase [Acidimicrobiales bacterium]